jgi:hypothetical protein
VSRFARKLRKEAKNWIPMVVGCALLGGTLAIVSGVSAKEVVMNSLGQEVLQNELGRKLTDREKQKLINKIKEVNLRR